MVWIDCEMTGLDPRKDKILEVAVRELLDFWQYIWPNICLSVFQVLITNGNLDLVDDGLEYAIKTEKKVLDGYVS